MIILKVYWLGGYEWQGRLTKCIIVKVNYYEHLLNLYIPKKYEPSHCII